MCEKVFRVRVSQRFLKVSEPTNVARRQPESVTRGSEPSNTQRSVVRALMRSPDSTANGSVVHDADADIPVANPHPVRTILPGDWRLTIHNLKQSNRDKFAQTFQTIFKKSEAWCNGLETLETVTTCYASRALTVLDESEDEEAMQIFGMEGVSTDMTIGMSPLLKDVLGESLTYMGITHPAQSTDLFSMSEDQEMLMTNKAVDLVGYVFPRTKDKPSTYNKFGQTLEHPAFWDNHLQWKQKSSGGKMCYMELCFTTPLGFLNEGDRNAHQTGLATLSGNPHSPVIRDN